MDFKLNRLWATPRVRRNMIIAVVSLLVVILVEFLRH
jgi:hypothetical protein